jgi:hypothetical protein
VRLRLTRVKKRVNCNTLLQTGRLDTSGSFTRLTINKKKKGLIVLRYCKRAVWIRLVALHDQQLTRKKRVNCITLHCRRAVWIRLVALRDQQLTRKKKGLIVLRYM